MIPHPVPERTWQIVGADYFMHGGKGYLLSVDYYSKYPELVEVRGKTSEITINVMKSVFARHGIPKKLVTDNMLFNSAVFQLQEKCQEQNVDLYSTYVDLTKAFGSVSREGLWRIMAKYGCPPKFITIVRLLHDGMMARVQDDGNSSEPFLVSNGVKQGCVLAPTLFSRMFSAMLTDAFADTDIGIGIRHRMDGSVFNLRRLKAKTKVKTDTINHFLLADDCALNSISVGDMQQNVDKFAEACTNLGLTISIKKTEVCTNQLLGRPTLNQASPSMVNV